MVLPWIPRVLLWALILRELVEHIALLIESLPRILMSAGIWVTFYLSSAFRGVGGSLRGFLHRAPPGSARIDGLEDKGCARRHKTASSSAASAAIMDEGDADLLPRLVVTSSFSCGSSVGVVVAVNACVPAARVWMLAVVIGIALIVVHHLLGAGWRVRTAAGSWRLRMCKLRGVKTLDQALRPDCVECEENMIAGAVVRTLSYDHVFHKACIDERLRDREHGMRCRICNRVARCVLPWKASPANRFSTSVLAAAARSPAGMTSTWPATTAASTSGSARRLAAYACCLGRRGRIRRSRTRRRGRPTMDLVGAMASLFFLHLLRAGWQMRMWTAAGWPYLAAGWETLRMWYRRRIWTLGGVTTLDQPLRPPCKLCEQKMMAGSVVRKLSCDHVFHKACVDGPRARHEMQNMQPCRSLRAAVEGVAGESDRPQRSEHIRARGGVRTLDRALNDACPICQHRMVASDDVRTLSCGRDFHEDCNIAKWLRDNKKACPVCRQINRPVQRME
uniref:RING-type domain-containing protein n=1 Tax=Oryza punctata TaxID=4537 RepID=A0A0E0KS41_ORYPU